MTRAKTQHMGPVQDDRVTSVLRRLDEERLQRPLGSGGGPAGGGSPDPMDYDWFGFSIDDRIGELLYLLVRIIRPRWIVEFATSVGKSTIYLASALRDNGGGRVIGAELVPAKVQAARRNLADAGLDDWAEIREGDARETLADVPGPIGLAFLDGWPTLEGPSPSLQVLKLLRPRLAVGAIVLNDNGEADYREHVEAMTNGFRTTPLALKDSPPQALPLLSVLDDATVGISQNVSST